MCLATPIQIDRIDKDFAYSGKTKVSIQLLKNVEKGDWILAHDNLAIATLPESEAKTILNLIKSTHCHCK
ncbi:HypC/HybG/HupF family hydrogenase formation chaperone [candidate division WS5 bacterium]|uniref:HypC/HybG/HupF family hydrogenase formation chaperone n=1 Tax=candidate division WS5 bacterium TaxID=2093353 RepID=A0A419DGW0_9BACT|nr:MAG: HypC/HybG/HupF family hydrogenase formation chaperone [candidate division WS5 bacterium]